VLGNRSRVDKCGGFVIMSIVYRMPLDSRPVSVKFSSDFLSKMNFGYEIYQFIYHVSSQRDVKHLHQKFCEQSSSSSLLFVNNILARTCQGLGPDNLNSPMHLPLNRIHSIGSVDEIMHFKHIKCSHEGTQHTPGSRV